MTILYRVPPTSTKSPLITFTWARAREGEARNEGTTERSSTAREKTTTYNQFVELSNLHPEGC